MLKDNINITVETAKIWLKVNPSDTDDDEFIHKLLDGAANRAQRFMNNEFTKGEVPADVEIWILKKVARDYEKRINGLVSEAVSDINKTFGQEEFDDLLPYRVFVGS